MPKKRRFIPPEKGEPGWVRRVYGDMEWTVRCTLEMTHIVTLMRRHGLYEFAPGLWMSRSLLEASARKSEGVLDPWKRVVIDRISGWVDFNLKHREPWIDETGNVRHGPPKAGEAGYAEHLKVGLRWVMESQLRVKNGTQYGVRDLPMTLREARRAGIPREDLEAIRQELIRELDLVEIRPGYLGNRGFTSHQEKPPQAAIQPTQR